MVFTLTREERVFIQKGLTLLGAWCDYFRELFYLAGTTSRFAEEGESSGGDRRDYQECFKIIMQKHSSAGRFN